MSPRTAWKMLRQQRYERACWWLDRGVDVVPLKPRSKHLQRGYGMQKAHITDAAHARRWFLETDANLAVVLGGEGRLIIADWDDVDDYRAWRHGVGSSVATLTERTARGYHLFFYGVSLRSDVGNGCEFKAHGVCAVSPSVHPSGVLYRVVKDVPIARLDEEEAITTFPFLSEMNDTRRYKRASHGPAKGVSVNRNRTPSANNSVIARIKAVRPTVVEMRNTGIELRPGGRKALVGLCPFHDDHHPSLWVNPESGLWGCNKPSCPAAGVHDVINFRALARGISNRAAIKQLTKEFLSRASG